MDRLLLRCRIGLACQWPLRRSAGLPGRKRVAVRELRVAGDIEVILLQPLRPRHAHVIACVVKAAGVGADGHIAAQTAIVAPSEDLFRICIEKDLGHRLFSVVTVTATIWPVS